MIKKVRKKQLFILLISLSFILVAGLGVFCYLKYYKTGADTLPRNTSCVIKVVDKDTGKPVVNANALFWVPVEGGQTISDLNGCISLPTGLKDSLVGDYYQVDIRSLNYETTTENLAISNDILSGKSNMTVKLTANSKSESSILITNYDQSISKNQYIKSVHAANNSKFINYKFIGFIYDAMSKSKDSEIPEKSAPIEGANVQIFDLENNGKNIGESCVTDTKGYCSISANVSVSDAANKKIRIDINKDGYRAESIIEYINSDTVFSNGEYTNSTSEFEYQSYLWPDYSEKISKLFKGNSKLSSCKGSYNIEASYVATKIEKSGPKWDEKQIQEAADYLATSICSLKQSKDGIKYVPIPRLYIINNYLYNATAYVREGGQAIMISNDALHGALPWTLKYHWLTHEYGHLVDFAQHSGYYQGYHEISGKVNFKNLFKLVNARDVKDNYEESLLVNCKETGALGEPGTPRCYFAKNEGEFWAESFALWMGQSFASELKMDLAYLKDLTIPYDESKFTSQALNTYNFWKKFMSTTLGTYCHPTLMDENGVKQGLSTYPVVEPKPSFTKGGPLASGVVYAPDQILAGTPLAGSSLTINYKKLPANYVASTMTDENFSIVPYSTGINELNLLAKFPATKGLWPDTLTSDANRCGIYERGMLAQSDKTADIKAADVKRGPYPLYSLKDYELRGYYRCNKTEPYKVADIRAKADLNTSTKDVVVDVDLSKYISCPKTTTPVAPGMPR